ncbi:MAG: hypothetical protein BWY22_01995 [Bacteroidetes bacterium ADurb.Bin217]|nr:MAG: hypothetical protein BWY22_01995 [Bacteroidetes bacterium ADurb.Bin217]
MSNLYSYTFTQDLHLLKPQVIEVLYNYITRYSSSAHHNVQQSTIRVAIPTFFFIEEVCSIEYKVTQHNLTINSNVEQRKFIQFLLFFILASALFSAFSVLFFLWFTGISLLVFIIIRYLYFRFFISGVIDFIMVRESTDEEISAMQQQWIENPNVCPACGTDINEYSQYCSECGLFIRHQPQISRFSVSENLEKYNLTYTITHEKD